MRTIATVDPDLIIFNAMTRELATAPRAGVEEGSTHSNGVDGVVGVVDGALTR